MSMFYPTLEAGQEFIRMRNAKVTPRLNRSRTENVKIFFQFQVYINRTNLH